MDKPPIHITVDIEASSMAEAGDILHRITQEVRDDYTSGFDRNDTSNYHYDVTGAPAQTPEDSDEDA